MEVIILSFFLSKSLIALNKEMQKSGFFLFHQSYCYDFRFLRFFSFCRRNKNCRILPKNRNLFFEPELRLETTANPHIHRDLTSCLQLKTIVFRRGVVSLSHVLWRTSYMTQQQGVHSTLALLLFVKLTRCGRKSFDWQLLVNSWALNAAGFY